MKEQLFADRYK